ncbi:MAG: DMT family transporter [Sphaerochaeta sp.]
MDRMTMEYRKKYILGILLTVLSSLFFGMLGYFNTLAEVAGLQFAERLFYRFLSAAICIFIVIEIRGGNLRISRTAVFKLIVGSVFFQSFTSAFLYMAYDLVGTGFTTVLHFTYPILVLALSVVKDKERPGRPQICGTFIALIGLFLIIGPTNTSNIKGTLIALASALTYTLYIRFLSDEDIKKIDSFTLMLYIFLISAVFWFLPALKEGINRHDILDMRGAVVSMIGLSLLGTTVAASLFNYCVRLIGGRMTSILSIFEPVSSVIIGLIALGESLTKGFGFGMIAIFIGIILVTAFEKQKKILE